MKYEHVINSLSGHKAILAKQAGEHERAGRSHEAHFDLGLVAEYEAAILCLEEAQAKAELDGEPG